ncbi:MAG: TlpA family protein disulfide reductase [Deltaproteobacteria bacterium]|nr:TlpA family protein disulfide reductase [Deltaproteobacteria bacterium]
MEPLERTWRGVGEWEDGARAATARWTTEKSAQAVYQPEVGQRRSGPVAGEIFPPWELSAEGIQIDSAALRGEVVILAFWASWCEPCQEELPELSALARRAADEGLPIRVIAVSMDESPRDYGRGRARLDLEGITVARDPVLGQRLRVSGLPSTWLVAPDGTATRLFSGYRKGQVQELEIAARALLTGQE